MYSQTLALLMQSSNGSLRRYMHRNGRIKRRTLCRGGARAVVGAGKSYLRCLPASEQDTAARMIRCP